MQSSPDCKCCRHATLNEENPDATERPAGYNKTEGDMYSIVRRFTGTNLISDYERDVGQLANVLRRWQEDGVNVVWVAATPQHFPPSGTFDVAHLTIPAQSDQPQNHAQARPSFNGTCLAEVASQPQLRNDVALPILQSKGIRAINLWEPLRTRGDMHHAHDCTHFCEPGDAVWLMANAALLAVLAVRWDALSRES